MMISINIIIHHLLAVSVFSFTESFTFTTQIKSCLRYSTGNQLLLAANVDNDDDADSDAMTGPKSGSVVSPSVSDDRYQKSSALKRELLQLAASYDRGFGATPRAREEASDIIQQLAAINPTKDAARGIDGNWEDGDAPLKGAWRMIWTTALDVVSLAASPIAGELPDYHNRPCHLMYD